MYMDYLFVHSKETWAISKWSSEADGCSWFMDNGVGVGSGTSQSACAVKSLAVWKVQLSSKAIARGRTGKQIALSVRWLEMSWLSQNIIITTYLRLTTIRIHDDVIKWNNFPRYWPFVRGIHRSPVNSPHKGQCCGIWCFLWYAPE